MHCKGTEHRIAFARHGIEEAAMPAEVHDLYVNALRESVPCEEDDFDMERSGLRVNLGGILRLPPTRSALAHSLALAEACGLVCVETRDGWSGIEALPGRWADVPGAHWQWRARLVPAEGGGDAGLTVEYDIAANRETFASIANRFGWSCRPGPMRADAVVATYAYPRPVVPTGDPLA